MDYSLSGKALTFVAPKQVELRPVSVAAPREGQVVVRTAYSGISAGSEMLAYRGELPADAPRDETISSLAGTFTYPFSYGYSCVGRVEESRCEIPVGSLVFAFHPHQNLLVVDASDVVPLPGDVPPRQATLFPLVETALQICLDAGPVLQRPIVVAGLGSVGLLTGVLLNRSGAGVIAAEPLAWRREVAARLGLRAVRPEDLRSAVDEATDGRGVSLGVEVTGSPGALPDLLPLLAHEGTALVASWYGTKPVPLPLGAEFHRRRLTIRSSQVSTIPSSMSSEWDVARRRAATVQLLRELPLAEVATHEFPYVDAADAYAAVDAAVPGLLHAALRYP